MKSDARKKSQNVNIISTDYKPSVKTNQGGWPLISGIQTTLERDTEG